MKTTRRNFLNSTVLAGGAAVLPGQKLLSQTAAPGLYWPASRALPEFAQPTHLDVGNIAQLPGDQQSLLVTLQGVVNRQQPRIYWIPSSDPTDQAWLDTIGVPNTVASDPWNLFSKYRSEIQGAIVYDPNLPDTVNIATSLAGINNAVIATAEQASSLKLPIIQNLTNLFNSKLAAYNWLFSQHWSSLSHRIVAAIGPTNTVQLPNVQWKTLLQVSGHVHDASNTAVYYIDLSSFLTNRGGTIYVRFQDAYPTEGWGPSVGEINVTTDTGTVVAHFQPGSYAEKPFLFDADSSQLASAWRFADDTSYFIYAFKPPLGTKKLTLEATMWNQYLVTATNTAPSQQVANPEFRDYIVATQALVFWLDPTDQYESVYFNQFLAALQPNSLYLGWFFDGDETQGVTLCSQNGVAVGATDYFNNATVFGGVPATIASSQPPAVMPKLENKIYVTFTMSEGDNIQYDQHRMRMIWDDPNRGQVPLNWSIDPLLIDAAPSMLHYYQRTQTENDFLVAGPSGAGYTYPGDWPAAALAAYTERTGSYMSRSGMNVIYALNRNDNTDLALTPAIAADYMRDVKPLGLLYNWESTSQLATPGGLPVFTQIGISAVSDGQTALANALASWDGKSPLFVAIGVLAWNLMPTDVNTLVDSLGSQFQVVRGDVFFRLLGQ